MYWSANYSGVSSAWLETRNTTHVLSEPLLRQRVCRNCAFNFHPLGARLSTIFLVLTFFPLPCNYHRDSFGQGV
jgi:hypothetical protein